MSKPALQPAAPPIFDAVLDRAQTEMPDWYLPSADGVLIAGQPVLDAIGYVSGGRDPAGWSRGASGFWKPGFDANIVLWVQECGQYWIVERSRSEGGERRDETLVYAFGPCPIWTRDRQAAMRLAEYCDPIPLAPVAGYWADDGQGSRGAAA
jgi:hypothetical protein